MATIREELVLADRFSATFSQYISAAQKTGGYTKDVANAAKQANAEAKMLAGAYNAAAQSRAVEAEQKQLAASFRASKAEQRKMAAASFAEAAASKAAAAASRARAADINAVAAAEKLEAARAKAAAQEQDRLNRSMRSGVSAADSLARKVMGLAAAYVGLQSAQKLTSLSDTWTQTNIGKWGLLQLYQTVDEAMNDAQVESQARAMLKYHNRRFRTLKCQALGILGLRAGQMLMMDVDILGGLMLQSWISVLIPILTRLCMLHL